MKNSETPRFCNLCGDRTGMEIENTTSGETCEINLCKYCLFRGSTIGGQVLFDNPEKEAQIKKFNDDRLEKTLRLDEIDEDP